MHERRESFVDSDWTILGVTCVGGIFIFDLNFLLIDITVICIVFRAYFLCIGFVKRPIMFIEHKIKIEYFYVVQSTIYSTITIE